MADYEIVKDSGVRGWWIHSEERTVAAFSLDEPLLDHHYHGQHNIKNVYLTDHAFRALAQAAGYVKADRDI